MGAPGGAVGSFRFLPLARFPITGTVSITGTVPIAGMIPVTGMVVGMLMESVDAMELSLWESEPEESLS